MSTTIGMHAGPSQAPFGTDARGRAPHRDGSGDNERLTRLATEVLRRVDEVVIGKHEVTSEVFMTLLAGGHVLLEDVPGVGKTTLALAFSRLLGLECTRLQLTPDVMPSDIVGFSMYRRDTGEFAYQKGAVFCNLLLADEMKRTSPKTQSALLEAMEERRVTVDGVTRRLPDPFFVIATQNPLGSAGTQTLPLSQLDRFMACTSLGYPDFASEVQMARGETGWRRTEQLAPVIDAGQLARMQEQAGRVYIHDAVLEYAVRLVASTRSHPSLQAGASPRATMALVAMARACAWLEGGDFVTPAMVARQFPYVVGHRVLLSTQARMAGTSVRDVLVDVVSGTARPRLGRAAERDHRR